MLDSITVVTITRERPHLLVRAIRSVRLQDYSGQIIHTIIVDDCGATAKMLTEGNYPTSQSFTWRLAQRRVGESSGPTRLARLRNSAVNVTETAWICFLDDDNEFEREHLSSLVACAIRTRSPAVHSHRKLFYSDGRPYLERNMPWKRCREERERIYCELRSKGIFTEGSNIVKDRADPKSHPDPARMVDMGEWLFRRELLIRFPFCEEYSYDDWLEVTPEDKKLLHTLVDHSVPIVSTCKPTLKYYLGGYSNRFAIDRSGGKWPRPANEDGCI